MDKERFDDVENTTFTDEIPDYERPEEDKMIEKLNKIESVDLIVEDEIDHGYTVVGKLSDSEFDKVKEIKEEHPQFAVGVIFMSGAQYIREEREGKL